MLYRYQAGQSEKFVFISGALNVTPLTQRIGITRLHLLTALDHNDLRTDNCDTKKNWSKSQYSQRPAFLPDGFYRCVVDIENGPLAGRREIL